MNVLIIHSNNVLLNELEELSNQTHVTSYIANSREEALGILADTRIDKVFFTLRTLPDLGFLKYLNTSHKDIEVILSVEESVNDIVNVLKYGQYKILPTPFKFSELKTYLEQGRQA